MDSISLSWMAATDDLSDQSALEYLAYYSTSDNLGTVSDIENNGSAVGTFTSGIDSVVVSSLTVSTTYYFNVVVRDEAGNEAAYSSVSETTAADTTAATPGASGELTVSDIDTTSLTLNWTAASDDVSDQSALEYLAYYSTSDDLATVSDIEDNGSAVGTFTAGIDSVVVSSLTAGTTYYFNVIVRDEAGNEAAYSSVSETTTAVNLEYDLTTDPGWSTTGDWEWGTPTGTSNPSSSDGACYGTGMDSEYTDEKTYDNDYVMVGPIDLSAYRQSGDLMLYFDWWLETDYGYDSATVQISTDGSSFETLYITTGTGYDFIDDYGDDVKNSWTDDYDDADNWQNSGCDLSAYSSQETVYIRWAIFTEEGFNYAGLFIDNVLIGRY